MGKSVDLLVSALLISFSCFLLLGASTLDGVQGNEDYAKKFAQNTLLVLQHVPVDRFGENFEYDFIFSENRSVEKKVRGKTLLHLVSEDVVLNPEWKTDSDRYDFEGNRSYSLELEKILKKSVRNLVGGKFGFLLIIESDNFVLHNEKVLDYKMTIADYEKSSKRLCSERISVAVFLPKGWDARYSDTSGLERHIEASTEMNSRDSGNPAARNRRHAVDLNVTLELWAE